MKRIKTLAIAAALLIGTAAFAQNQDGPQRPQRKHLSAEEVATMQTERMAKSLELTDKQKAEIYKINLESAAEQQKEREEMMKMMQERREKQKAREEACDERMQKILAAVWDKAARVVSAEAADRWEDPKVSAAVSTTAWDSKFFSPIFTRNPIFHSRQ